eukprot:8261618-Ditylum_brightwellii.AAC.1
MHGNDLSSDMSGSDENEASCNNHPFEDSSEHPRKKDVWYYKLEAFLNHIRGINFSLIYVLGMYLSLDEMMIRFYSRSNETHCIKSKPILEGQKCFALITTEGFLVSFTSHGRFAAKSGRQEYEVYKI